MRGIVLGTIAVVVSSVAACGGDDSSTAPDTTDAGVDTGTDSGGVVLDSGGVDAGDDGSSPKDAGPDGAYTGPPTFCSGKTSAFCSDFDRSTTDIALGWDSKFVDTGALIAFSTSMAVSLPQSAAVSLTANAGTKRAVFDKKVATGGKRRVKVSFDWRVKSYTLGTGDALAFFAVTEDDGTTTTGATVTVGHDQSNGWRVGVLTSSTGTSASAALDAPPFDAWHAVVLDVVFADTTTGSMSVSFDGVVAGTMTSVKTSEKSTTTGARFTMGVGSLSATNPVVEALYDNVQMELP